MSGTILEVTATKRGTGEVVAQHLAKLELPTNVIIKVTIEGQPLRCLIVITDEGIVFLGDPDNPETKWKLPSRP